MTHFVINPYYFLEGVRWDPPNSTANCIFDTAERGINKVGGTGEVGRLRFPKSTGKWYVEVRVDDPTDTGNLCSFGVMSVDVKNTGWTSIDNGGNYFWWRNNSQGFHGSTYVPGSEPGQWLVAGTILAVALDADTGQVVFYKNGNVVFAPTLSLGLPFTVAIFFEPANYHFTVKTEAERVYPMPVGYSYWNENPALSYTPLTWNPGDNFGLNLVSPAYYTTGGNAGTNGGIRGFPGKTSTDSKWYLEISTAGGSIIDGSGPFIGLSTASAVLGSVSGIGANAWGVLANGNAWNGSTSTPYGTSINNGIVMLAHDPATGNWWAGKNGTWFNGGNPATGANPGGTTTIGTLFPTFNLQSIGAGCNAVIREVNAYPVPSGFTTYNLS